MPATEQTWRDLKILHVVFGVVALILLLATVSRSMMVVVQR